MKNSFYIFFEILFWKLFIDFFSNQMCVLHKKTYSREYLLLRFYNETIIPTHFMCIK